MPGMLDGVRIGDWLAINDRGSLRFERVIRISTVIVETERCKFTLQGVRWPSRKSSVTARPALAHEIERWIS